MTWSALFLTLMGVAMYANPVLLFFAWSRRLRTRAPRNLRVLLGWFSLGLASAAFLAFAVFVVAGPQPATSAFDVWFRKWLILATILSAVAFLTGLAGRGKMQWAVPVSALITPMSVLLQKILE
jgi:hypothetical protein